MPKKQPRTSLEYAGNRWMDCVGATPERTAKLEQELNTSLPEDVKALFETCAGGAPERPFFFSPTHEFEAVLGYVLLIDPEPKPPTRQRATVSGALKAISQDSARKGMSATDLVPFAIDNGGANYYCLDGEGRVVYRVLHEPPESERQLVADSFSELVEGLEELPW